jgi:ribosomal protein S18 acetylase RimI-like enzyme
LASICIREFRVADDYASAVRLWDGMEQGIHVGPSDAQDEIQKKLERDPDLFLIAEANGLLIGTVIGGFDGRRGFIYHLAVHASYRSQGIGSRLMDEVESRLRSKGCIRCYLFVTPDNEAAMRYYEKRGWILMDNLPYAKDLV